MKGLGRKEGDSGLGLLLWIRDGALDGPFCQLGLYGWKFPLVPRDRGCIWAF